MANLSEIRDSKGNLPAFAWPGGYPVVYIAKDNGILCPKCANDYTPEREQLESVAYFVHYEGPTEQCEHCNALIDSAYGVPEGN